MQQESTTPTPDSDHAVYMKYVEARALTTVAFVTADAVIAAGGSKVEAGHLMAVETCRRRESGVLVDIINVYDAPCEPKVAMETVTGAEFQKMLCTDDM